MGKYVNYISTISLVLLADVSVNTNWKGAFISRATNEINNHTHKNETLSEKAFSYLFRFAFLRETYDIDATSEYIKIEETASLEIATQYFKNHFTRKKFQYGYNYVCNPCFRKPWFNKCFRQ